MNPKMQSYTALILKLCVTNFNLQNHTPYSCLVN